MSIDPKSNATDTTPVHQNHTKAAEHCDAASMAHKEAAKHAQAGDAKHAGYHAAVAHGHTIQANEHSEIACQKTANAVTAGK